MPHKAAHTVQTHAAGSTTAVSVDPAESAADAAADENALEPEALTESESDYPHKTTQGARLPGWPDINCERLAAAMLCHPMHLRGVLSGRLGTTLNYIERIGEATGLHPANVVARILEAREADEERLLRVQQRWAEKQLRRREKLAPNKKLEL